MALPNPTGAPNIYTLAADNSSARLISALHEDSSLLNSQDATGYSLVHALASYNHLTLLRTISTTFPSLNPNLADEDGETALFVVETVAAAQCLVEDLDINWRHENAAGETAEQKIRSEGEFVAVADYLGEVRRAGEGESGTNGVSETAEQHPPRLPPGISLEMGSLTTEQAEEQLGEPDLEFRRRIEQLAAREDFQSEDGQRQLRELVQDAVRGVSSTGGGTGTDGDGEGRETRRQRTE